MTYHKATAPWTRRVAGGRRSRHPRARDREPRRGAEDCEFRCTACEQRLAVDEALRASLLEFGCPVCGADVEAPQFTETERA